MTLLVDEIAIIKPHVVIIMTTDGHYNWHLNNYRWLENEPFKDADDKSQLIRESMLLHKIDQLKAQGSLPEHTYQICHPNVLRRKDGGYKKNADELIQALIHQIKP